MESEAERKHRLSHAHFVVDTTPFKTALQKPNTQQRRRSRGNVGKTNRETTESKKSTGSADTNPRFTKIPSREKTVPKKVTFEQAVTKNEQDKVEVPLSETEQSGANIRKVAVRDGNTSSGVEKEVQTLQRSETRPETNEPENIQENNPQSIITSQNPTVSTSRHKSFQARSSWSIPRHSTKAPLRSLLLDPSVNTLKKHRRYSEVKDAMKKVNKAHPSYDIDGDGIVGPEDMAIARLCDTEGLGKLSDMQLQQSRVERAAKYFQDNQDNLWLFGEDMVGKTVRENVESLFTRCSDPKKFALAVLNLKTKERALKSTSSNNMKMCISGIEDSKKDDITHKPIHPPLLISSSLRGSSQGRENSNQKMFSSTHVRVFGDPGGKKQTLYERQRNFTRKLEADRMASDQNSRQSASTSNLHTQVSQAGMRRCRTRSELQEVRHRERLRTAENLYKSYGDPLSKYDNKKVGLVDFMIAPPEKQHRGLDRVLQSLLHQK